MRQRWKGADRIFQFIKQRVAGKKWQWATADRYPPILANRNRSVTRCRGAITAGGAGQVSGRARSGFLPHFIWGFLLSELWSRRGECHTDPGETVVARHMSGPWCRVTGRRGTEWASYPPPPITHLQHRVQNTAITWNFRPSPSLLQQNLVNSWRRCGENCTFFNTFDCAVRSEIGR